MSARLLPGTLGTFFGLAPNPLPSVVLPPTFTKSFSLPFDESFVVPGGTAELVLTITNPNTTTNLSGVTFIDNLPPGLVIASPSDVTNTCGGVLTAPEGGTTITLIGGVVGAADLTAPNSCAISVRVRAITVAHQNQHDDAFFNAVPRWRYSNSFSTCFGQNVDPLYR